MAKPTTPKAKPASARKAAPTKAAKAKKIAADQEADRAAAGFAPDPASAPQSHEQTEFGTGNAGQMGGKAQFSAKWTDMRGKLTEGGRHILITQEFQGQEPEILVSGDQEEARQFFQMFRDSFAFSELAPNS